VPCHDHISRGSRRLVLVMFVSLLIERWGWIEKGSMCSSNNRRRTPGSSTRVCHSLFLSIAYGLYMLDYSVTTVLRQARPNMMVMFAFEFAVSTITSSSTAARYAISLREALYHQGADSRKARGAEG
jgi:E3 ubiquitin-protein ligase synoviolin